MEGPLCEDSVFSLCYLDENTINSVLSMFNFRMLLVIQILMARIQVSDEDEISPNLSYDFKVMKT